MSGFPGEAEAHSSGLGPEPLRFPQAPRGAKGVAEGAPLEEPFLCYPSHVSSFATEARLLEAERKKGRSVSQGHPALPRAPELCRVGEGWLPWGMFGCRSQTE